MIHLEIKHILLNGAKYCYLSLFIPCTQIHVSSHQLDCKLTQDYVMSLLRMFKEM